MTVHAESMFLILSEPIQDDSDKINSEAAKFSNRNKSTLLDKTRTLLRDFYAPYNQELASILHDDRFLWQ
jgi:N-acetylgalactosamine 4-sulfate 6-O-sulfotransferase